MNEEFFSNEVLEEEKEEETLEEDNDLGEELSIEDGDFDDDMDVPALETEE